MRDLTPPAGGLFLVGLLFRPSLDLDRFENELTSHVQALAHSKMILCSEGWHPAQGLPKIAMRSPEVPFHYTNYYRPEMGDDLLRLFLIYEGVWSQDLLVPAKQMAREMETMFLDTGGNRTVNVDPGILTLERLVLATSKNFLHRIYLADGIFADLTLIYKKGGFVPLEWTFPDYQDVWTLDFLNSARKGLKVLLKQANMI